MKGKLHKSMNYGWMVQDETGFYPLYPYDLFTNSIERVEGKEVDFIVVHSWNAQEEKLIEVAIISANITDVPFKQETLYTEEQVREAIEMARGIKDDEMTFDISSIIGCGEVCTYGWKEEYTNEQIIQSLKQPKKD